jgi:hypothetical protein
MSSTRYARPLRNEVTRLGPAKLAPSSASKARCRGVGLKKAKNTCPDQQANRMWLVRMDTNRWRREAHKGLHHKGNHQHHALIRGRALVQDVPDHSVLAKNHLVSPW